jgi:hypothetical protein
MELVGNIVFYCKREETPSIKRSFLSIHLCNWRLEDYGEIEKRLKVGAWR